MEHTDRTAVATKSGARTQAWVGQSTETDEAKEHRDDGTDSKRDRRRGGRRCSMRAQ